jgi:hypothetical protein
MEYCYGAGLEPSGIGRGYRAVVQTTGCRSTLPLWIPKEQDIEKHGIGWNGTGLNHDFPLFFGILNALILAMRWRLWLSAAEFGC